MNRFFTTLLTAGLIVCMHNGASNQNLNSSNTQQLYWTSPTLTKCNNQNLFYNFIQGLTRHCWGKHIQGYQLTNSRHFFETTIKHENPIPEKFATTAQKEQAKFVFLDLCAKLANLFNSKLKLKADASIHVISPTMFTLKGKFANSGNPVPRVPADGALEFDETSNSNDPEFPAQSYEPNAFKILSSTFNPSETTPAFQLKIIPHYEEKEKYIIIEAIPLQQQYTTTISAILNKSALIYAAGFLGDEILNPNSQLNLNYKQTIGFQYNVNQNAQNITVKATPLYKDPTVLTEEQIKQRKKEFQEWLKNRGLNENTQISEKSFIKAFGPFI